MAAIDSLSPKKVRKFKLDHRSKLNKVANFEINFKNPETQDLIRSKKSSIPEKKLFQELPHYPDTPHECTVLNWSIASFLLINPTLK